MRRAFIILVISIGGFHAYPQNEGIVLIKSTPTGAIVSINGDKTGKTTPYQSFLPAGNHTFSVDLQLYRRYEGTISISENETKVVDVELVPAFGSLKIITEPTGADIELDGVKTGKKTPCLLEKIQTGSHQIAVSLTHYRSISRPAKIDDGKITDITFNLEPLFGTVAVITEPKADIYINGEKEGNSLFTGRLDSGRYVIEAKLEGYSTGLKIIEIHPGSEERLSFTLYPRLGTLAIMTIPPELEVSVDGQSKGISPVIVSGLIIGNHLVKITDTKGRQREYKALISENQTTKLEINVDQVVDSALIPLSEVSASNKIELPALNRETRYEQSPPADGIYIIVDIMPEFPGGEQELWKFIRENLTYPVSAMENKTQGKIVVRFCINETGNIENVSVLNSLSPDLDKEAMRVVRKLPPWSPGLNNGKPVKVWYTLPISFRIIE